MATQHADEPHDWRGAAVVGAGRQAIENNPLTPDEITIFELFEREGWSAERRRAYILALV